MKLTKISQGLLEHAVVLVQAVVLQAGLTPSARNHGYHSGRRATAGYILESPASDKSIL